MLNITIMKTTSKIGSEKLVKNTINFNYEVEELVHGEIRKLIKIYLRFAKHFDFLF